MVIALRESSDQQIFLLVVPIEVYFFSWALADESECLGELLDASDAACLMPHL